METSRGRLPEECAEYPENNSPEKPTPDYPQSDPFGVLGNIPEVSPLDILDREPDTLEI